MLAKVRRTYGYARMVAAYEESAAEQEGARTAPFPLMVAAVFAELVVRDLLRVTVCHWVGHTFVALPHEGYSEKMQPDGYCRRCGCAM